MSIKCDVWGIPMFRVAGADYSIDQMAEANPDDAELQTWMAEAAVGDALKRVHAEPVTRVA